MKYRPIDSKVIGILSTIIFLHLSAFSIAQTYDTTFDIVVYGGTSAGVVAAIQAKKWAKRWY